MARRKNHRRSQYTRLNVPPRVIILLVAAAFIIGGLILYASTQRKKQHDAAQSAMEQAGPRAVAGDSLIYTVIPDGLPHADKNYTGFYVCFNPENHTPNWVGWELTAAETEGRISRSNKFWTDDDLPGCPSTDDYRRSGYDRGHLFPAAEAKWDSDAMRECFSLANIAPQDNSLNSGAWKTLEEKERLWAAKMGRLIIVAGPLYQAGDKNCIGATQVRVPSAFFKVILAPEQSRCIGFIYNNSHCPGRMENYMLSVDEVEEFTGFDFFSSLPDEIENDIEARKEASFWNR